MTTNLVGKKNLCIVIRNLKTSWMFCVYFLNCSPRYNVIDMTRWFHCYKQCWICLHQKVINNRNLKQQKIDSDLIQSDDSVSCFVCGCVQLLTSSQLTDKWRLFVIGKFNSSSLDFKQVLSNFLIYILYFIFVM